MVQSNLIKIIDSSSFRVECRPKKRGKELKRERLVLWLGRGELFLRPGWGNLKRPQPRKTAESSNKILVLPLLSGYFHI